MTSSASAPESLMPQDIINPTNRPSGEQARPSTPLEMSTLESRPVADTQPTVSEDAHDTSSSLPLHESEQKEQELQPVTTSPNVPSTAHAPLDRTMSTAIGPSSDQPIAMPKDSELTGPILMITLLPINGARHPFKLDAKYLSKRNVKATDDDPYNLSVYTLKELILREWREEWEAKPSSPSSIRLISFGKLLDDKAPLKDSRFSHDSPNVVHMTIKPQEIVDEEDAKGGKGAFSTRDREGSERSPGCRCVIL